MLSGCSQFDTEHGQAWEAEVVAGKRHEVVAAKGAGWQPVSAKPDQRWSRPKVIEVSYEPLTSCGGSK